VTTGGSPKLQHTSTSKHFKIFMGHYLTRSRQYEVNKVLLI